MRRLSRLGDPAAQALPLSTDELLRGVSSALRADEKQVRALVLKARKNAATSPRERVGKELKAAFAQLRAAAPTQTAGPPGPRGARLAALTPLPPLSRRRPSSPGSTAPVAARRDDLAALRRIGGSNTARAYAAIQHNARAIDSLAATQRKLAATVAELQSRGDLLLLKDLFDSLKGLEIRLGKAERAQRLALSDHKRAVLREQRSLRKTLRLQARGAKLQKLNHVAASMQSAAFGTKGSPLSRNNVLLAGNTLLWDFAGDLLEVLGFRGAAQTSAWEWLGPVASLVTGQLALGRQQHERFVSGVATTFNRFGTIVEHRSSLEKHVAPGLWPSFRNRVDVVVTARLVGAAGSGRAVDAWVEHGVLVIRLPSPGSSHGAFVAAGDRVAWVVDTGDPNG